MIHNNYFNIVDISQYNITSSTSERLTHTLALSTRTVLPNLRLFCWARVTLSVTLRASGDDDMAKANTAVYNFTRDHSWLQNVWQTKSACLISTEGDGHNSGQNIIKKWQLAKEKWWRFLNFHILFLPNWSTYQIGWISVGADTELIRLSGYFYTQVWWIHITVSSLMAKNVSLTFMGCQLFDTTAVPGHTYWSYLTSFIGCDVVTADVELSFNKRALVLY